MQILIGGEDEVAFHLAEALMDEHDVTVLLPKEANSAGLERLDVRIFSGSTSSGSDLEAAGGADADHFLACSPVDEKNLVACAAAKRLGARQVTCFLPRHNVQETESEASKLAFSLGIDRVILPAEKLAKEILRIVLIPGALDVEAFEGGRVRLVKKEVKEGVHIASGDLRSIGVPKGVVLVMCRRGEEIFIPQGDTHFQPGDQITAMGDVKGINRLLTRYLRDRSRTDPRRATIVGGGLVGTTVARGLLAAKWKVKIIEADEDRATDLAAELDCMVIHGDGTDISIFEEEHIGEDPVLVAVTSNDEKNLLVSLLAKQEGVSRIVTRADKSSNERLFERAGIDVVRSARGAAINSVLRAINASDKDLIAELDHGDVKVLRLDVPEELPPTPLKEMRAPVFAIIGAVMRGGKVIIPHGSDTVQGGDSILVFCATEDEETTRGFFDTFPNQAKA
jgi:trk system potassium uptake protein TrkA